MKTEIIIIVERNKINHGQTNYEIINHFQSPINTGSTLCGKFLNRDNMSFDSIIVDKKITHLKEITCPLCCYGISQILLIPKYILKY